MWLILYSWFCYRVCNWIFYTERRNSMTDKEKLEAIRAEIHRLVDVKGYDREMANDLFAFMNSLPNEPVSDELEEACDSYYDETWDEHGGRAMVVDGCHDIWFPSLATDDFFKAGAKWQKAKDESTTELAEEHAMLSGMEKMKEEMMAKAKSGTVQKDNQVILDDGTYIDLDPSMQLKPSFVGLKEGDRIKVIVIKED